MRILTLENRKTPEIATSTKSCGKLKNCLVFSNAKYYEKESKKLVDANLIRDYCSPTLFSEACG